MDFDFRPLASGDKWEIEWKRIQGEESISFRFDSSSVIDASALAAIRKHGAWHLYCRRHWEGGDLSVFKPVVDIVEKISLPSEKNTKIIGLDCLTNLKAMSVSGDVTAVDFTKFRQLNSLTVNQNCKGGNWHLCESMDFLLIDVSIPNLKKLNALKNLRSLSCGRGLKSFEGIADLPSLRELRVGPAQLSSVDSLGDLPTLRLLMLNLMPKLGSLKGIEGLPNLEELDVTQCGALQDVSAVSALKNLEKLVLAFCPKIRSLQGVTLPRNCDVEFVPNGQVSDGF